MDRSVVVSGGGTGMGRAIARSFALDGDRVAILGRRAGVLAEAAHELNAEAGAAWSPFTPPISRWRRRSSRWRSSSATWT